MFPGINMEIKKFLYEQLMILLKNIPHNYLYTPIQITVPDNKECRSIRYIWNNIHQLNEDEYSYVSHFSLAREYNLIYTLIKTDKLDKLYHPYTEIKISSAQNINLYKLNYNLELIIKNENNITVVVNHHGIQLWYKEGKFHRDNDLPAVIYPDGSKEWFKEGNCHRNNDLPAIILANGYKAWYQKGKCHRDNDLPAVIHANGTKQWYKEGKFHRDNDLPAVIYPDGSKYWYKEGLQYSRFPIK